MATARLYIPTGTQTYGPIPGGSDVTEAIGSNTAEIVSIAGNGNVLLDASFVRGNDCIKILGNSADYSISSNVAGITLTAANGAVIRIPSFAPDGGIKITFNDVEVALKTTNGTTFVLDGPNTDQTITGTPSGLTVGSGTGGGGSTGTEFALTVSADTYTDAAHRTSGDDTYTAIVSVNQNGEQTNQLQSGDKINGGAGYDTLDAEVQDASALNGKPVAEIAINTSDVEEFRISAQQANSASDDDAIQLDMTKAYGVEKLVSSFSDASLTFYDVNTLGDGGPTDPTNGLDNGRPTSSITICMDHTAGENVLFCASDLEVYFDADYLIPGEPDVGATEIRLQLLDIDNQIGGLVPSIGSSPAPGNQPLLTNPFDRLFITFGDGTIKTVDIDNPATPLVNEARNDLFGIAAYQAFTANLNAALQRAGLTTFTAVVTTQFTVVDPDGSPGGNATGYNIVITDSSGSVITNVQFGASGAVPGDTDYQKEIFINEKPDTPDLITSNLCVFKAGNGGEGGDFIVGSMNTGGIERFILEIQGHDAGTGGVNVDQDSNIASLTSTNNTLQEVILTAAAGVTADLTIGNSVTEGYVPNMRYDGPISWEQGVEYDDEYCGNLYGDNNYCDLTSSKNNAMRDVQLFDATLLNSSIDVTLYAHLSAEFTGKYLDLMDQQPDPKADNVAATYLFAGGNDHLNMNIAQENFAYSGAATREDFSFFTNTRGGDDLVQIQIGDGNSFDFLQRGADVQSDLVALFGSTEHWYTNHLLNQNLTIITGAGNDKVETWGSTAAFIETDSGNDVVFTDNSGGGDNYIWDTSVLDTADEIYNCDRPVWVFNSQNNDVNDLLSFGRATGITNAKDIALTVQYMDFIVTVDIPGTHVAGGTTLTDLEINQAIKAAINSSTAANENADNSGTNKVLSDFLIARDGPSGTLIVESKVDGYTSATDLTIRLGASSTTTTGAGRGFGALTNAELANLGFNPDGTPITSAAHNRWDAEFGTSYGDTLNGQDSINVNNNRVWLGGGNDELALSSNGTSIEHVIIKKGESFGTDHILNFTAAVADAVIPAETEVQEVCVSLTGDTAAQDFEIDIEIPGADPIQVVIEAGQTIDQINTAIQMAIDESGASSYVEAAVNTTTDCVEITYTTGIDYDQVQAVIVPVNPTEVQAVTVGGDEQVQDYQVRVDFAGFSFLTPVIEATAADHGTNAETTTAIVNAINNADNPLVHATQTGATTFNLEYFGNTDPAAGVASVISSAVATNVTITDGSFVAFNPGAAVDTDTINDGAPQIDPALGYDIFDVSDIVGAAKPAYFVNDQQLDNDEYVQINNLVDSGKNGVILIDTVELNDFSFSSGTPSDASAPSELARIQQMVNAADDGTQSGTNTSVIITVNDNAGLSQSGPDTDGTIGRFYQVVDGSAAHDATVTYLGTVVLGGYDDVSKDAIGNWDAMTIANFTTLTATQLMTTYTGGII